MELFKHQKDGVEIKLTKGLVAIIDKDDYEKISSFKWCSEHELGQIDSRGRIRKPYAIRRDKLGIVRMHHQILKVIGKRVMVDHKNGNTLDNRKLNLRICTHQQNSANSRKSCNRIYSSRFKGVCWDKGRNSWMAKIKFSQKYIFIGRYSRELDAAKAYNKKAKELFGDFSCLNQT